jgi:hypothetical protein
MGRKDKYWIKLARDLVRYRAFPKRYWTFGFENSTVCWVNVNFRTQTAITAIAGSAASTHLLAVSRAALTNKLTYNMTDLKETHFKIHDFAIQKIKKNISVVRLICYALIQKYYDSLIQSLLSLRNNVFTTQSMFIFYVITFSHNNDVFNSNFRGLINLTQIRASGGQCPALVVRYNFVDRI